MLSVVNFYSSFSWNKKIKTVVKFTMQLFIRYLPREHSIREITTLFLNYVTIQNLS